MAFVQQPVELQSCPPARFHQRDESQRREANSGARIGKEMSLLEAAPVESLLPAVESTLVPLTQEDIDRDAPVPPKLGKDASAEEKAAREALMKLRRKMQEKLRQQSREPQRVHSADNASAQRAAQRALKAPAIALNAVNSAAIPLTFEAERPLHKIIDQAEKQLAKLPDLPCENSDICFATHKLDHAILVLLWKKYCSLELKPVVRHIITFGIDDDGCTRDLRDRRLEFYRRLKAELDVLIHDPMCARLMAHYDAQTEPEPPMEPMTVEDGVLV